MKPPPIAPLSSQRGPRHTAGPAPSEAREGSGFRVLARAEDPSDSAFAAAALLFKNHSCDADIPQDGPRRGGFRCINTMGKLCPCRSAWKPQVSKIIQKSISQATYLEMTAMTTPCFGGSAPTAITLSRRNPSLLRLIRHF